MNYKNSTSEQPQTNDLAEASAATVLFDFIFRKRSNGQDNLRVDRIILFGGAFFYIGAVIAFFCFIIKFKPKNKPELQLFKKKVYKYFRNYTILVFAYLAVFVGAWIFSEFDNASYTGSSVLLFLHYLCTFTLKLLEHYRETEFVRKEINKSPRFYIHAFTVFFNMAGTTVNSICAAYDFYNPTMATVYLGANLLLAFLLLYPIYKCGHRKNHVEDTCIDENSMELKTFHGKMDNLAYNEREFVPLTNICTDKEVLGNIHSALVHVSEGISGDSIASHGDSQSINAMT